MRSETVTFYTDCRGTKCTFVVGDILRIERASAASCHIYVRTKSGADRIRVLCDINTARGLVEWCKS